MTFEEIYTRLKGLGVDYEAFHHKPVLTCEEADALDGHPATGKSKNLFLRNKKGNQHYLVVIGSEARADLSGLAKKLGEEKLSFASEGRLDKFLKQKPGCVSPLGLLYDQDGHVKVLIQKKILDSELLSFHPNVNTISLIISSQGFQKFLKSCSQDIIYFDDID